DEGGQLTEAVRRKPYSVVLFDEIEKAHPDVFNVLLQVLDDGHLTDNKGRKVNFKNTIIIMTSNIGSQLIQEKFAGATDDKRMEQIYDDTKNELFELLKKTVRPEFLNRIDDIIMFTPLSKADIREIVNLQFNIVNERLEGAGIKAEVSDAAIDWLADKGYDPQFGARPVKRLIQNKLLNQLSKSLLQGDLDDCKSVLIDVVDGELTFKSKD
ncbi:MAG: AAA family ATPase, partial [Bacteroidales bacterium]